MRAKSPSSDSKLAAAREDIELRTHSHPDSDKSDNDDPAADRLSSTAAEPRPQTTDDDRAAPQKRSWRFWLVFLSLCLSCFSAAVDATIVTTSLPTIVAKVGGADDYVWIANSFLLASTVPQPLVGQLADLFGRRWPMLTSVALFMVGSGIAGGAHDVATLLAGRVVQGLGGSGIFVLIEIITCDLVAVRDRGKYIGLVLTSGALGTTLGPVLGGVLAERDWRWVYWITIPTAGTALVAFVLFLHVNTAAEVRGARALRRIDYFGTAVFVPSITAVLLAVIMGDAEYPWGSWHIIVPLVLGFCGWAAFHVYEMSPLCRYPSIPPRLFGNRTSFTGFIIAFNVNMLLLWVSLFLPIYFQGVLGTSPLTSGVNLLPLCFFMLPSGVVAGAALAKWGRFQPLHALGFAILCVGFGLLSLLDQHSSKAAWVCFQIVTAIGIGPVLSTILPAIQAPLAESDQAAITAMFSFMRSFGYVWGATIPAVIFNAMFDRYSHVISDPAVRANLSGGRAYSFVSGSYIRSLEPVVSTQVIDTYVKALRIVWLVGVAFSGLGFLLVFVEKHYDLRTELDTQYGLKEGSKEEKSKDHS